MFDYLGEDEEIVQIFHVPPSCPPANNAWRLNQSS